MVKVLGINASPRKYGNTFKLLKVALEAAAREGAETKLIHLYDYEIKPCIGCVSDEQKACRFPCVIEDGGTEVIKEIHASDAVIIATPLYWYGPSGHLKNLIDRMTAFENMIFIDGRSWLEGKVFGFIAVGNDSGAIMAIAYLMVTLNSMGAVIPPWALAYYTEEGDVLNAMNRVLDAANVGKVVVKAAKALKDVREWYDPTLTEWLRKEVIPKVREEARKAYEVQYPEREPKIKKLMK